MAFNPVALPKKGMSEEDMRRVWNAENVAIAYKAYEEGKPLIATPFLTGMPHLRRPGLLYEWSEEELLEAAKCREDILYFVDNYCQLYRPDGTYGPVKLRPYQRKYLKMLQNNRFVVYVASRQIGKTVGAALFLLWSMIFRPFCKMAIIGDKAATAIENVSKIKEIYNRLPFFLKPGVVRWNQATIAFDNGSLLISGPTVLSTLVGKTLNYVYFDEAAIPEDKTVREVFEFIYPTLTTQDDAHLIMTSSPRGAHGIFYETYTKAKYGKSPFAALETHWNEVPGRDEQWKDDQIAILGEKGFAQQYDCQFLADDNDWLSIEATMLLNSLMLETEYTAAIQLTDNERAILNLAKVENVIMRSKYKTKGMTKPKHSLLSMLTFDKKQVESLNALRDTPIIITIDTGEGKYSDYTIVNFWRPEFGDDQQQMLLEAYQSEIAEIELNAQQDAASYTDEEDAFDAMFDADDIDADALSNEFLMKSTIRCRQIGHLSSNAHSIPMVALFVQIFVHYFCHPDKVKIVCELDGIGAKMQALLSTDIIANAAIEFEQFGSCDNKGNPGVYMRGKNKAGYVYDTKQLVEDARLLPTYGSTIFEVGKFKEIKPGKFAGVDAHDDEAMTVVHCGAYMSSADFAMWIDDMFYPDDEDAED